MPPSSATTSQRRAADWFPLTRGLVRGLSARGRTRLPLPCSALATLLGGGLPCGVITEVFGTQSSGRTALAHALVSAAIAAGECAAWIDLPNALDPHDSPMAGAAGVLWIQPADAIAAFRAAEHVIGAGGFRVVVLDLTTPERPPAPVPASIWLRVTRAAVQHDAAVLVLSTTHIVGTFAALSLEAVRRRRTFVGGDGPACLFAGMISALHLRKNKLGPSVSTSVDLVVSTAA